MLTSQPRPSDRYIPYYFVAFFVVLALLLGGFVWLAIHNYSGEVTDNAYNKGLHYDADIARENAQEKLGWQSDVKFITSNFDVNTDVILRDSKGVPITGAKVNVWFIRSTNAGHDVQLTLASAGNGHYSGKTTLFWKGAWDVQVSATYNGHNYQVRKNLYLR